MSHLSRRTEIPAGLTGSIETPAVWNIYGPYWHPFYQTEPADWPMPDFPDGDSAPAELSWYGHAFPRCEVSPLRHQYEFKQELADHPVEPEMDKRSAAGFLVILELKSETAQQVSWGFGGVSHLTAWLNGAEVAASPTIKPRGTPSVIDQVVSLSLRAGTNLLCIRLLGRPLSVLQYPLCLATGGPDAIREGDFRSILTDPMLAEDSWQLTPIRGSASSEAIDIGSRRELFVDDYLIDTLGGGLHLQMHHPEHREVAFQTNQQWEGSSTAYLKVFPVGDKFHLYYSARPDTKGGRSDYAPDQFACVAESSDGIHFERVPVGTHEFAGSCDNNIVYSGKPGHNFAPFLDTNPACAKDERFKALAFHPDQKRCLAAYTSPDGLQWKLMQEEPVLRDGSFDSQNIAFWDDERGRYLAYARDNSSGYRRFRVSESTDFRNWSEQTYLTYTDEEKIHFYVPSIQPYFRAPHLLIGTPARFMPLRTLYPNHGVNGCSDAMLIASRDGSHFYRWKAGFLRPSTDPMNWTDRNNYPACGILQTGPDELSLYWTENYRFATNHVRRGVLRLDGFGSLQAGAESVGEVLTRPFMFTGDSLHINFATSAAGSMRIGLTDIDGRPLPGFDLTDCEILIGNEIDYSVRWHTSRSLAELNGQPVRIRARLFDTDWYALRFQ